MLRPWTALKRFIAHVFDFYFGLHENVVSEFHLLYYSRKKNTCTFKNTLKELKHRGSSGKGNKDPQAGDTLTP